MVADVFTLYVGVRTNSMNKTDVIRKVSESSEIPEETCAKVLSALERVLQDELGANGGLGALGKITGILNYLTGDKGK